LLSTYIICDHYQIAIYSTIQYKGAAITDRAERISKAEFLKPILFIFIPFFVKLKAHRMDRLPINELQRIVHVLLLIMVFHGLAAASDSTLTDRRIAKIRALAKDLSSIQFTDGMVKGDSTTLVAAYRSMLQKYFPRNVLTAEFNMLYPLRVFHHISQKYGLDSTAFRMPDAAKDSLVDIRPLKHYSANTVIMYFAMYGSEWEGFYFAFREASDELIFLLDAGGENDDYRRKKIFLDKISEMYQVNSSATQSNRLATIKPFRFV